MNAYWSRIAGRAAVAAALLAAAALAGGCEGDGDGGYVEFEYTEGTTYGEPIRGAVRYDYVVHVTVLDPRGYRVPGVEVECVVADVPEIRAFARTDGRGYAGFDVATLPGVLVSVYVNDYRYTGDGVAVFTSRDLYEIDVVATLAW